MAFRMWLMLFRISDLFVTYVLRYKSLKFQATLSFFSKIKKWIFHSDCVFRSIFLYLSKSHLQNFLYPTVTSARACNNVGHLFWFTILAQHETNDVILYVHSVHKHRGNSFQRQNYKMNLKQRSLNWINFMQVKTSLFTNVFFSWSLCLLNMFPSMPSWYSPSICIFPVCWHNRHHSSWPFLECRPSK